MTYYAIYAVSKDLRMTTTALMAKRALQISGTHWHKVFIFRTEKNLTPHRVLELSIIKLLQSQKKLDFIMTTNVIFGSEMGQIPTEILDILDIIFCRIQNSNIFLGGVSLIFTIDHT